MSQEVDWENQGEGETQPFVTWQTGESPGLEHRDRQQHPEIEGNR